MAIAYAAEVDLLADPTVQAIIHEIVQPIILFIFGLALLYFLWGVARFIISMSSGDVDGKKDGQKHMIYGIVGLAIMLSVFGIMNFIFNTVTDDGRAQGIQGPVPKPSSIDHL